MRYSNQILKTYLEILIPKLEEEEEGFILYNSLKTINK